MMYKSCLCNHINKTSCSIYFIHLYVIYVFKCTKSFSSTWQKVQKTITSPLAMTYLAQDYALEILFAIERNQSFLKKWEIPFWGSQKCTRQVFHARSFCTRYRGNYQRLPGTLKRIQRQLEEAQLAKDRTVWATIKIAQKAVLQVCLNLH